mmetsp:Transcript_11077/g.31337  ORF Transcript_11077/g.31337 Transcript_11077/m.31337 type:complete len:1135 (-) Transcript_11077:60-3464(-)
MSDSASLEAAKAQVEAACAQFELPATRQQAEATLLEFRKCANPLQVCRYIIERSPVTSARFQALLTLREAAVREWGHLSAEDRSGLRTFLLHCLLSGAGGSEQLVCSQLSATLAQVIKRGWSEQSKEQQIALFQEVEAAVLQTGDPQGRRRGVEILSAVVTEFSPPTASPMGLPWVYHERCRMSLETDFLQRFFAHTCNIAREAVASGAAVSGADGGTTQACITLLSNILSWDFQRGGGGIGGGGFGFIPESAQKGGSSDTMQVHLGPGWRAVLLAPGSISWLLELVGVLQTRQPGSPALIAGRGLVVQLCGVIGDIFPKDTEGVEAKRQYCQVLLKTVLSWAWPAETLVAAANEGQFQLQDQIVDCCRGILALSTTHRVDGILRASEGTHLASTPGGVCGHIAALTRALTACGAVEEGLEGRWSASASEILLDAWVALLEETAAGSKDPAVVEHRPAVASAAVFEAFAAGALRDLASPEALEGEEDDEGEEYGAAARSSEWMGRLAMVARASALQSLPLLAGLLAQRLQQLQACAAAGRDPSLPLEELCWLVRCSSHSLADAGDGETPMMPLPLVELVEALPPGAACPVRELSNGLITVVRICLDASALPVLSPRLLEVAANGVARWARTYLLPDQHLPTALASLYSPQGDGPRLLDSLVKVAREVLSSWPGEVQLHLVASKHLLPALMCRPNLNVAIVQLDSWQALARDFAGRAGWVKQLDGRSQRALACAIVTSAQGLTTPQDTHQYLVSCLGFLPPSIGAVLQASGAATEQSQAVLEAANLLDIIRGTAVATCGSNAEHVWLLMEALLQALLNLYQAYRRNDVVVTLVLKVACSLVEAQIAYVTDQQAGTLCAWVIELTRMHAANRKGEVNSSAGSRALHEQAELEGYRELKALLKLLTQLTQRDVAERSQGSGVDIAQAVFVGLELILPLITSHISHFPKLRVLYYGLLCYMAEVHAPRLASLPARQFSTLASSLEYGIRTTMESEAVQAALEAAAALGQWHVKDCQTGGSGLGQHTMPSGSLVLSSLMEALLQRLLFEDSATEVGDAAADALLPMLLACPGTYQVLGNSLLSSRSAAGDSTAAQDSLAGALQQLVAGLTDGASRTERRQFQAGLNKFLVTVRGLVRTR